MLRAKGGRCPPPSADGGAGWSGGGGYPAGAGGEKGSDGGKSEDGQAQGGAGTGVGLPFTIR